MGTDFVVSVRGFLFSLGYIQALQCNKNLCPTGITTHNPRLLKGLDPKVKVERVAYLEIIAITLSSAVCQGRAFCGFRPNQPSLTVQNGLILKLEQALKPLFGVIDSL